MNLDSFRLGLWIPVGASLRELPQGSLAQADNIEYFSGDDGKVRLRGRKGRSTFGTTTGAVLGIQRFYPRSGSKTTVVAAQNGATVDLRHDTADVGTYSAITGGSGFATGKRWHWAMWPSQNKMFGVNGSNGLKSYDGAVVATVTVVTGAAVDGPYITLLKNRLYAARTAFKDYLVDVSELNDPTDFSYQIPISENQGGSLAGLEAFGDQVLIFKSSKNFAFSGDIRYSPSVIEISDRGCVAPETIDSTAYGVVYLGADGLYVTNGIKDDALNISGPLRGLFLTTEGDAVVYPNAVGHYYQLKDQYYLTLDPSNPLTTSYVLTRMVLPDGQAALCWSRHAALPMNAAGTWDSETDDRRMLIGDTSGNIYRIDKGFLDGSTAFTCSALTAPIALGGETRLGRIGAVDAMYRGSVPLTFSIRYDGHTVDDVSYPLGEPQAVGLQFPYLTVTDYAHWGRYAQVGVSNDTDGPRFELGSLDLQAELKHRDYWRRT